MIEKKEILEHYMLEVIRDNINILESEYPDLPEMPEIISHINLLFDEHAKSIFRNAHSCFSDSSISGESLSAEEDEAGEISTYIIRKIESLEKNISRDDYLFLMIVCTEDDKIEAEHRLEALSLAPDKLHLHIIAAIDDDSMENLPVMIGKLMAIPVAPVTEIEKNFFLLVRLLELLEFRLQDCTAETITGILKKISLHPLIMYSILYNLSDSLEKEISSEIFKKLNLPGNDKHNFGKLLVGALCYRMGKFLMAVQLLQAADIPQTPVSPEHQLEYQYYLAKSYQKTGQAGKFFLLIKEIYEEPHNKGILCIYWLYTILDFAEYYLKQGNTEQAEIILMTNETCNTDFVPFEKLPDYFRMLGDIYQRKRPKQAHKCYMKSELIKVNNN